MSLFGDSYFGTKPFAILVQKIINVFGLKDTPILNCKIFLVAYAIELQGFLALWAGLPRKILYW